jgi:prepilin-type processing-associated H-X9-DG protein
MEDFYREDLAAIHDAGYGDLARRAGEFLLAELHRRGTRDGLVIDLGCGTGILAERLSADGFDVLGIDISRAMIALAQKRVPKGTFRSQSLFTADLPPCVAIAMVGEGLNYLFHDGHSPEQVRRVLGRAFTALAPSGLLILDVAEPGRVTGPGPSRNFAEADGWAVLVTTEEDRQQELLTRSITSFRKIRNLYRRDHEVHQLRLLPRTLIFSWLQKIGFEVQILSGYGPAPFVQGHVGFLAAKPQ